MRPEAHLKGLGMRWMVVFAMVVGTLGLHARDAGMEPAPRQSAATLVYLASGKLDREGASNWAEEIKSAVSQDLVESGVIHLLDPSRVAEGLEPSAYRQWSMAGADYLLRTMARPAVHGKLFLECKCVQLGTQTMLLNKVFVGERQAVQRIAHRLADFVVGKVTGTPGVADSSILFSRQAASGVREIYSVGRDGRDFRKLTSFGSISTHPALSADGKLALVTYKGGPPQIWGQVKPGGSMRKLFPLEGQGGRELSDLSWSPDGSRLAFVQDDLKGGTGIHVLDLRTNRVSQWTEKGTSAVSPSWNPGGTALAYISNRNGVTQVFTQSSDCAQARQLTTDPGQKTKVAWSPLGDRIAYASRIEGESAIFTLAPDGEARHKVESQTGSIASLCWAPDGRWLLLGQRGTRGSQLRITSLDGTSHDLALGFAECQTPQWTRNGSPIASLFPAGLSADHTAASPYGLQPL